MSIEDQANKKMAVAIEHLQVELKNIRTGRANPGLVESVTVEVYGSGMRLKDLASISSPEARQLLISPFDPNTIGAIAKALNAANLGVQAIAEGNGVRIKIPPMDDSVRKDMVKLCKQRCEEAKVSIRHARRECIDSLKKEKNDGLITEDQVKGLEKKVQDVTNKFCNQADELCSSKEKEVCEI